jgi:hypothetical protein
VQVALGQFRKRRAYRQTKILFDHQKPAHVDGMRRSDWPLTVVAEDLHQELGCCEHTDLHPSINGCQSSCRLPLSH